MYLLCWNWKFLDVEVSRRNVKIHVETNDVTEALNCDWQKQIGQAFRPIEGQHEQKIIIQVNFDIFI